VLLISISRFRFSATDSSDNNHQRGGDEMNFLYANRDYHLLKLEELDYSDEEAGFVIWQSADQNIVHIVYVNPVYPTRNIFSYQKVLKTRQLRAKLNIIHA
jgi:hypothetical protein